MADPAESIEPHIPALRRYAWALCRDGHEADDLVQACLERALGRLHLWHRVGGLRPWLFAILHNLFVSGRRQRSRRGVHGQLDAAVEIGRPAGQDGTLAVQDVVAALDTLPEEQRAVILLVGVEDLSYAEAAKVLGVPVGTVMSRLSRGRERLRQVVDGERPAALRRVK